MSGSTFFFKLVGAAQDQAHRAELVDRRDQRRGRVDAGDLLDDDARRHRVRALPAVLLGHVYRIETRRVQRITSLLREPCVLVDVRGVRSDLLLRQRADRRPQLVVLLGQLEHVERRITAPTSHLSLLATRR